ncbi:hypothetical protein D6C77_06848 [Aureobasidium pullulans]|nr:hypothetical protein D6C77_06848 [Aureobasidium pullulans]
MSSYRTYQSLSSRGATVSTFGSTRDLRARASLPSQGRFKEAINRKVTPLYTPSSTRYPTPLATCGVRRRLFVPPPSPRTLRIMFRLFTETNPALGEAADRRKSKGHIDANPIIIVTVPISYSISSIIRSDRLAIC